MAESVRVAGEAVPFEQALAVVMGYCLGRDSLEWRPRQSGVGDDLEELEVGAFAYRTYDCIPGSSGRGIEAIDVLVADGLNGQMRARHIAAVLAVAREVSAALAAIDEDLLFWELHPSEVSTPPESPDERAWPIWRAWSVLAGTRGVKSARTHKILHHKRPGVFPLIDRKTVRLLGRDPWGQIHDDLAATEPGWVALEDQVNPHLIEADGVELTRLRLHDILLWCRATKNTPRAEELGQRILDGGG